MAAHQLSQFSQSLPWRIQAGANTRLVTGFSLNTYHTSLHSPENLADSGFLGNNRIRTFPDLCITGTTTPARGKRTPLLKRISL